MTSHIMYIGIIALTGIISLTSHAKTITHLKQENGVTLITDQGNKYRGRLEVQKVNTYPDSNVHQYRNYGATEAAVAPSQSRNKNAFDAIIQQAAQTYGVSAGLIKAVMHTESGFNIHARSPVGAQGLMQLMPATARRFNVSNPYDPQQNIMAGAKYLAWLLKRFNGNTSLALAGYNAGEGNVQKYGGIPPFRETQDYVRRVQSRYNNLYSNGVSLQASSTTKHEPTKIISASANYNTGTEIAKSTPPSKRQIIINGDSSFTDAPATGSYATAYATASAKIYFSD